MSSQEQASRVWGQGPNLACPPSSCMSSSTSAVWIGSPFTQPENEGVESDDPLQLENLVKEIYIFFPLQTAT